MPGRDGRRIEQFARQMGRDRYRPNLVLIEDQYIPQGTDPDDDLGVRLKRLVESRTRFLHALEIQKLDIELVMPDVWQLELLGKERLIDAKSRRPRRKMAARIFGVRRYGPKAARGQDEWDALCLATWGAQWR